MHSSVSRRAVVVLTVGSLAAAACLGERPLGVSEGVAGTTLVGSAGHDVNAETSASGASGESGKGSNDQNGLTGGRNQNQEDTAGYGGANTYGGGTTNVQGGHAQSGGGSHASADGGAGTSGGGPANAEGGYEGGGSHAGGSGGTTGGSLAGAGSPEQSTGGATSAGGGSTSASGTGGVAGGAGTSSSPSGGTEASAGQGGVPAVGPPTTLAFVASPSRGYTDTPLSPIRIEIQDSRGNIVPEAEDPVTIEIEDNPGGSNLVGYLTANASQGVAVFGTVGLDRPGNGYRLRASASGFPNAACAAFDVTPLPFRRVVTGMYGGQVQRIAITNEVAPTLYASSPAGVFKSTNRGGTWSAANFGNPGGAGLIISDPSDPLTLYITPSFGGGSYGVETFFFGGKTTNGGAAWRAIGQTVGAGQIGSFAIDPVNPSIVYAGGPFGLYRSTDGGESWSTTAFGHACYALTIDPVSPEILYAYAYDQNNQEALGIYKSIDSGTAWAPINNPDLGPEQLRVSDLFATPTGVFATFGTTMFWSVDGGASWQEHPTAAWTVAYAPSNVSRVYAGRGSNVMVSDDGGETFGSAVPVGAVLNGLAVEPWDANRVYAATEAGAYASTDGGATWDPSSVGISALSLGAVAIDPAAPSTVLVGAPSGVYRTTNGGTTWAYAELGDRVTALTVDSEDSTLVYACTLGAHLHRSTDGGATWSTAIDTGGGVYCYNIEVRGDRLWVPTVGGGVRRSVDGGVTWQATTVTDSSYAVAADATGTHVYAGTNAGTFKSTDGGVTWDVMVAEDLASALLVDPVDPTIVYAGMACGSGAGGAQGSGGIKRSTDSGATWEQVASGPCVRAMGSLSDGTLYATGRGSPLFTMSTDQGTSWAQSGFGIVGEPQGFAVASDHQTIYVATLLGLYKSVTGGL